MAIVPRDTAENCHKLKIDSPILSDQEYAKILNLDWPMLQVAKLSLAYDLTDTPDRLAHVLRIFSRRRKTRLMAVQRF